MDSLRIHHYGLATNNIQASMDVFHSLGYSSGDVFIDPIQKVKLVFVSRPGEPMIELICDLDEAGPTKNIISKSGNGFYHICYEIDNMEESMEKLRNLGFMLKHKPVAATAFQGRKIAWMYNRSVGLVELLEKQ
jgi:methylmalonyl-CoA/ethylmalonyl-CoA epimerase